MTQPRDFSTKELLRSIADQSFRVGFLAGALWQREHPRARHAPSRARIEEIRAQIDEESKVA